MRLYPEKLAGDLQRQLHRVYLVSGEETLLVQECADQIRAAARAAGCTERRVLDAGQRGFDWQDLLQDAGSLSLFAEQRLLELRIPNGKPGSEGSKALCSYVEQLPENDVLLIVAGRIDKASTNSKWYKALDGAGATLQLWPVNPAELPGWLHKRAQAMGLAIDREAVALLAERVEGNLLAAVQELEKLHLAAAADDAPVDATRVAEAVADSARFNPYGMLDAALAGRRDDSLRMLHGLRAEGNAPAALLWAFTRELRQLRALTFAVAEGQHPAQVLQQARVWKSRQPLVQAALDRHSLPSTEALLQRAAHTDACIKGYGVGNPWEDLEALLLGLASDGETALALPV